MDTGSKKSQLLPSACCRQENISGKKCSAVCSRSLIVLAVVSAIAAGTFNGITSVMVAGIAAAAAYAAAYSSLRIEKATPSELTQKLETATSELEHQRLSAQAAEDHSDLLTNTIAASIIIRDRNNKTVFCSPFTQVLTGHEVAQFADHNGDFLRELVVAKDLDRYDRALKVSFLGEDTIVRYRIKHRSGLKLWLETRLVPVCNDEGEAESVMAITIDVTETLNYQRQIEEHNRDLADFTYMVSHDLKAPVFTIKGMAQVLKEDYSAVLGSGGLELVQFILDGGDRLEQLIKSVIDYSAISIRGGETAPVALNSVLNKVLADHNTQARDADATIEIAPGLPTVQGDEIRLYQLFSNLVGNAIKYRRRNIPLRVTVDAVQLPEGGALIRVKDNGLGIPPEKLDQVFRPYQRAHSNQVEGSGIGLACVKKIIDRLGGSVTVESTVGEGSTFMVTFPAALPAPQSIPPELQKAFEA